MNEYQKTLVQICIKKEIKELKVMRDKARIWIEHPKNTARQSETYFIKYNNLNDEIEALEKALEEIK